MNYFRVILHGAHLVAHTWASRAILHGVFFGLFSTPKVSFFAFRTEIIAQKSACVDKMKRDFLENVVLLISDETGTVFSRISLS